MSSLAGVGIPIQPPICAWFTHSPSPQGVKPGLLDPKCRVRATFGGRDWDYVRARGARERVRPAGPFGEPCSAGPFAEGLSGLSRPRPRERACPFSATPGVDL